MLLVEDSTRKEDRVRDLVGRIIPDTEVDIHTARSATEAGSCLKKHRYDLLVLDIQLPMRDLESPKADGGLVVLRALKERKEYKRPTYVVGLSAFPDLVTQFEADFSDEMWHLICYREDSDDWTLQLSRLLIHLADSVSPAPGGNYEHDIAIITALHKVELEAVLALSVDWARKNFEGDPTVYHFGEFLGSNGRLHAVTAAATEVGMPSASALAMKMIMKFKPRYLALVGIAAGVKGQFGDILVASQVWDYGSGRLSTDGHAKSAFEPAPSPIPMAPFLHSRFEAFGLDAGPLRRIQSNWPGTEARGGPLEVKLGPIASGAAVVADRPIIDDLVSRNRKLIGIEMEAYGVFVAASQAPDPKPLVMCVKGICDFGDVEKNDEYQRYAAYTSSSYLYEFVLTELAVVAGVDGKRA